MAAQPPAKQERFASVMYRNDLNNGDRAGTIALVALIHAALAYAFLNISGTMRVIEQESKHASIVSFHPKHASLLPCCSSGAFGTRQKIDWASLSFPSSNIRRHTCVVGVLNCVFTREA